MDARKSYRRILAFVVTLLPAGFALLGCLPTDECLECGRFELVGGFADPQISECSGLVASRLNPGVLWVHNDSGDSARLYAVSEDGTLLGIYTIEGAQAVDWEDMAWGPCTPYGAVDCLFVGDIGDNAEQRETIQVYRVEEPSVPLDGPFVFEILEPAERFDCQYPDGPHDAETLVVDPDEGIPYIVTKEQPGNTAVYRFPAPPEPDEGADGLP